MPTTPITKTLFIGCVSGLLLSLSACDDSDSNSGANQDAADCLATSAAEKEGSNYRHKVHNLCAKTIQVVESTHKQRFAIPKNNHIEIVLPTATPSLGACFDPYQPEIQDDGTYQCKK